jgi:integrase
MAEWLFRPGERSRSPSEKHVECSLRRLGYANDEATLRGFRANAATLLKETGRWNADAIERQRAHIQRNDVRRAYARGEPWDESTRIEARRAVTQEAQLVNCCRDRNTRSQSCKRVIDKS